MLEKRMSSSGGNTGHKSPFPGRLNPAKLSPFIPKRSGVVQRGVPETGKPHGTQKSLVFGCRDNRTGSPSKVGQWRAEQADSNEPTTPTKMSEGGFLDNPRHGACKEDFTNFSRRRIATPIKTLKPCLGATPPRSPKRPYQGSPKYQKVLVERPAFYNASVEESPKPAQPKTEVSIAQLQDRLKKFFQDENSSPPLLEIPLMTRSSPKVNPISHDSCTPLQVAKGGVAFTAGISVKSQRKLARSPQPKRRLDLSREVISAHGDSSNSIQEGELKSTSLHYTSLREIHDCPPRSLQVSRGGVAFIAGASDDFVFNPAEMLPLPTQEDSLLCQIEEIVDGPLPPSPIITSKEEDREAVSTPEVRGLNEDSSSTDVIEEAAECLSTSMAADVISDLIAVEEAGVCVGVEFRESELDMGVHLKEKEEFGTEFEEDEIEEMILQSWPKWFAKQLMLTVMMACLLSAMVVASGSPGLLPKCLHANPIAKSVRDYTGLSYPFFPNPNGLIGLVEDHKDILCQPAVQPRMDAILTMMNFDASQFEGFADGYIHGYPALSLTQMESKGTRTIDVQEPYWMRTVAALFQDFHERFLPHMVSLASDSTSTDPSRSVMSRDKKRGNPSELVDLIVDSRKQEAHSLETCSWYAGFVPILEVGVSDRLNPVIEVSGKRQPDAVLISDVSSFYTVEDGACTIAGEGLYLPTKEVSSVEVEVLPPGEMDEPPNIDIATMEDSVSSDKIAVNEIPILGCVQEVQAHIDLNDVGDIVDLLQNHVDEIVNTVDSGSHFHEVVEYLSPETGKESVIEPAGRIHQTDANIFETTSADQILPLDVFPIMATIGSVVTLLAIAMPFMLRSRKNTPISNQRSNVQSLTETGPFFTPSVSPTALACTQSGYDTHIPDKQEELDVISSPCIKVNTPRKFGSQKLSTGCGIASPAMSAPAFYARSIAHVKEKPTMSAQTWLFATPKKEIFSTISSSYRQTLSFNPSESGMSTTASVSVRAMDSVAESMLSMGAEELDQLGSYTTSELISVYEVGGDVKLTPVRRSQRIRNLAMSPLPARN